LTTVLVFQNFHINQHQNAKKGQVIAMHFAILNTFQLRFQREQQKIEEKREITHDMLAYSIITRRLPHSPP
jgi:hypothetical protein